MTEQQTIDAASGVRLIGGEVMTRDLPQITRPGSVAYLTHSILDTAAGRTLLLGARAASLLDVIRPDRPVDVLVRSLPDARDLASRAQERDHLRVFCGGFERFTPTTPYDVVVCLDGPSGLLTPDSEPLSHAGTFGRIADLMTASGQAVVAVANDLGIDNVFRLNLRTLFDDDGAWYRGADQFDQRRAVYPELDGLLAGAGLTSHRLYCGYPTFDLMSLLVTPEVTDDQDSQAGVEALIARTEAQGRSLGPSLVDLYAMSRRFLEAGMARQTAPGWLLVLSKGEAEVTDTPQLLLSEDGTEPEWASIMSATTGAGGWRREIISLVGMNTMIERRVARDLGALGDELPTGTLLEAQLRAECERGNIIGIRRLVRDYAAFLTDEGAWEGAAKRKRFFAVPGNVVRSADGSSLTLFDTSWSWSEDLSAELTLARGLRDFARRLLGSGCEHPWQPDISPDALTQTLLAMAERPWSESLAEDIAVREAELEVVLRGTRDRTEGEIVAENRALGSSQVSGASAPSRGYREALSTVGRMSQELHERGDQVKWLEASLRQRDQKVAETQRQLARVKSSPSYLLGRRITRPARRMGMQATGRVKTLALTTIPPRYTARVERAFNRAGI